MTEPTYPGLPDRVKSAMMDVVVIILLMVAAKYIFSSFDEVPDSARAAVFIFIWAVYEPLLISMFGATLGHAANGICVKTSRRSDQEHHFPACVHQICR